MVGPIEQALDRLGFDIIHPTSVNPAPDAKGRRGYVDLLHAYSNMWVEIARQFPAHWAGRLIAWATPVWFYFLVSSIIKII